MLLQSKISYGQKKVQPWNGELKNCAGEKEFECKNPSDCNNEQQWTLVVASKDLVDPNPEVWLNLHEPVH